MNRGRLRHDSWGGGRTLWGREETGWEKRKREEMKERVGMEGVSGRLPHQGRDRRPCMLAVIRNTYNNFSD
jgi:hypothetical protein